jgi:hypothetical protein
MRRNRSIRVGIFTNGAIGTAYLIASHSIHADTNAPQVGEKSRVIVIRDKDLLNADETINKSVLEKMVDEGVKSLFRLLRQKRHGRRLLNLKI